MTDLSEADLLLVGDEFLLEKMREARITADRKQCHFVLAAILLSRHNRMNQWKASLKSLCKIMKEDEFTISEPECQEILDQLVNATFALNFGERYFPSEEIVDAWESRLQELRFKS